MFAPPSTLPFMNLLSSIAQRFILRIKAVNQEADHVLTTFDSKSLSSNQKKAIIGSSLSRLESIVEAYQPYIADLSIREHKGAIKKKDILNCYDVLTAYENRLRTHLINLSSQIQKL